MSDTNQLFETIFASLPLGVVAFDEHLRVIRCNPLAAELLDAGDHDSLVEVLTEGTAGLDPCDWHTELTRVGRGHTQRRFANVRLRAPNGQERFVSILATALCTQGDSAAGGVLILEDVTPLMTMEKRLAVSERMAAVGRLAAKVAHELNNPLDGILRYISLARRVAQGGNPEKLGEYLEQAHKGLVRVIRVVGDLLEFSRGKQTGFEEATLEELLDEAIRVSQDRADQHGVTIVRDYHPAPSPAGRASNLFHVFCNLVKNAIDAMPDGGTLTIRTAEQDGQTCVVIQDTGIGLPPQAEHIFEPFFTTKAPGQGTGLGLAVCKDIVQRHGGTIAAERVQTSEGGTIFRVCLPADAATPRDSRVLAGVGPSHHRPGGPS
jgi:signal transduction histidine kinase